MIWSRSDRLGKNPNTYACATDGTIILRSVVPSRQNSSPIFTETSEVTNDKAVVDQLALIVTSKGLGSFSFNISGETYALAVATSSASDNTLYIANIYKAAELHEAGYSFLSNLSVALFILLLIVVVGITYLVQMHLRILEKIKSYDTTDPLLKCNTYKKFCIDAEQILRKQDNQIRAGTRHRSKSIPLYHRKF